MGYKPYAPPPDLNKVQTTINNRQNTAVRKRMEENKNRKPVKIGNGMLHLTMGAGRGEAHWSY